ncbi:MAG: hypothetical protein Q9M92_06220 [Enterobacterales bacterium]|nr:hypothetical protein [Enterobacterales bacterium]
MSSSIVFATVHQYQIEIDEKIDQAKVTACFDGKVPEYLSIARKSARQDLVQFPHSDQGKIEIQGRYWLTEGLADNACIVYAVSLKHYHAQRSRQSAKRKNIAYLEDNSWLWLPETITEKENVQLNFKLPEWAAISAPWHLIKNSKHQFLIGSQPQEWGYTLIIGDFNVTHAQLKGGQMLNIATMKTIPDPQPIIQWLTDTGNALGNYLGQYPVKQTQLIVIPKSKGGPVPWGDVSRGNGFGIRLVVVPSKDIQLFYKDWTVTHEFSHQLLPKLDYDDSWLSEGLSSYLQYVLMAQSQIITKEKAWQKLYQGFERGEKGTPKSNREPLSETSSNRRHGGGSGRTMRIYIGAAHCIFTS